MNQAGRLSMMRGGARLPYKKRVEYLEQPAGATHDAATDYKDFCISTGTSINTVSDEVEFTIDYLSQGNIYFSTEDGVVQTYTAWQIASMGNIMASKRADATRSHTYLYYLSPTRCYVKDLTNNSFPCDAAGTAGDFVTDALWMFSTQNRTGYSRRPRIRLYYLKIRRNGTLIRDFIPVIDWNDEPCMYDAVSNTNFYNAGTGTFIAGPDL